MGNTRKKISQQVDTTSNEALREARAEARELRARECAARDAFYASKHS